MERLLTLEQILRFVDSSSKRRNLTKAEEILSSNLVMCGLNSEEDEQIDEEDDRVQIVAICLPHPSDKNKKCSYEVNLTLFKNENEWTIQDIGCSCKSRSCKHCIAVLLYCNRYDITDYMDDIIKSTDPKHTEFFDKMPVVPISEMCFEKTVVPQPQLSRTEKKKIREDSLKQFPNSAYDARYESWRQNMITRDISKKCVVNTDSIDRDEILSKLLDACPDSALAQMLRPKKKEMAEQPDQAGSSKM